MSDKRATSLYIDTEIWYKVKVKALAQRKTVTQWIAEAIELKLKEK